MAFDNSEDSLHVYYLILPLLSVHSNLFHHKHLNMLQKSTFSGSPNQKQGSYIKQFCVTPGITYYKQCKTFIYVESWWNLHVFGGQLDPCCFVTDGRLLIGSIL